MTFTPRITMIDVRTHLKKVFWPNLGVGSGFQILGIPAYACGLKPGPAYTLDQNPFFEIGSSIRSSATTSIALFGILIRYYRTVLPNGKGFNEVFNRFAGVH